MSGGDEVEVDPDILRYLAQGWVLVVDDLGQGQPPAASGSWPSQAATNVMHAAVVMRNGHLQLKLMSLAGATNAAAASYQAQDAQGAAGIKKPGELGPIKDLLNVLTQVGGQMANSTTQAVGQGVNSGFQAATQVITSTTSPISSLLGQVMGHMPMGEHGAHLGVDPGAGAGDGSQSHAQQPADRDRQATADA